MIVSCVTHLTALVPFHAVEINLRFVWMEMVAAGIEPDEASYAALMDAFLAAGHPQTVERILAHMLQDGVVLCFLSGLQINLVAFLWYS